MIRCECGKKCKSETGLKLHKIRCSVRSNQKKFEYDISESSVEYNTFHELPVMQIKRNEMDKYPFSFGRAKAKLIVKHFTEIKTFAEGD